MNVCTREWVDHERQELENCDEAEFTMYAFHTNTSIYIILVSSSFIYNSKRCARSILSLFDQYCRSVLLFTDAPVTAAARD